MLRLLHDVAMLASLTPASKRPQTPLASLTLAHKLFFGNRFEDISMRLEFFRIM